MLNQIWASDCCCAQPHLYSVEFKTVSSFRVDGAPVGARDVRVTQRVAQPWTCHHVVAHVNFFMYSTPSVPFPQLILLLQLLLLPLIRLVLPLLLPRLLRLPRLRCSSTFFFNLTSSTSTMRFCIGVGAGCFNALTQMHCGQHCRSRVPYTSLQL